MQDWVQRLAADKTLLLFNYDWDVAGFGAYAPSAAVEGFDLFSFPSNAQLIGFDLDKAAARWARRHADAKAVVSAHEQFGALAAALVAEKLGLPGTSPAAVVACQHKLHARRVLEEVAPECNVPFALLPCEYGADVPELPAGMSYPLFVKPVKAAFSVLARTVRSRAELQSHTRFGWRELWVIRRLVEPFNRVAQRLLPGIEPAHRMLLEGLGNPSRRAGQFNLDGYVFKGEVRAIGVVDAAMYPGTEAFMRFDFPSKLPQRVQDRALDVARRFLSRVGFDHGCFNMEFFYDAADDRLTVIEFNPRLASQLSDLYKRVLGVDGHQVALALAHGLDPATLPNSPATAGAASSFVYRCFEPGHEPQAVDAGRVRAALSVFPDALILPMPKDGHSLDRDYWWLGSHRYGIVHMGGADELHLRRRCETISAMLGWRLPYADAHPAQSADIPEGLLWAAQ
jgi:hypothetical protein